MSQQKDHWHTAVKQSDIKSKWRHARLSVLDINDFKSRGVTRNADGNSEQRVASENES